MISRAEAELAGHISSGKKLWKPNTNYGESKALMFYLYTMVKRPCKSGRPVKPLEIRSVGDSADAVVPHRCHYPDSLMPNEYTPALVPSPSSWCPLSAVMDFAIKDEVAGQLRATTHSSSALGAQKPRRRKARRRTSQKRLLLRHHGT